MHRRESSASPASPKENRLSAAPGSEEESTEGKVALQLIENYFFEAEFKGGPPTGEVQLENYYPLERLHLPSLKTLGG